MPELCQNPNGSVVSLAISFSCQFPVQTFDRENESDIMRTVAIMKKLMNKKYLDVFVTYAVYYFIFIERSGQPNFPITGHPHYYMKIFTTTMKRSRRIPFKIKKQDIMFGSFRIPSTSIIITLVIMRKAETWTLSLMMMINFL